MSSPTDPQFAPTPPTAPATPASPNDPSGYRPASGWTSADAQPSAGAPRPSDSTPTAPPPYGAPVAPTTNSPMFAPPQASPWQTPQYGPPQQPYGSAQPPYGYAAIPPTGGQPAQKKSAKTGVVVVVGLVMLALIAGAIWYATRSSQPAPIPTTSSGASVVPSVSATPSPAPAKFAPGPGTTSSVRHYLEGLNYQCVDEQTTGIVSYVCLLRGEPESTIYVAGLPDGHLGRIAASVSDEDDRTHIAVQKYLLEQFIGDSKRVASTLDLFAKGTLKRYADASIGDLSLAGAPNGSMVAYVDRWLPTSLANPKIGFVQGQLTAALHGYSCEPADSGETCTKQVGDLTYSVAFNVQSGDLTMVKLWASGPGSEAAFHTEATRILESLSPDLAKEIAALREKDRDGYAFVGGLMLDYYRNVEVASGGKASGVYIRTSCWAGQQSWC